jgi:hypothetical protein
MLSLPWLKADLFLACEDEGRKRSDCVLVHQEGVVRVLFFQLRGTGRNKANFDAGDWWGEDLGRGLRNNIAVEPKYVVKLKDRDSRNDVSTPVLRSQLIGWWWWWWWLFCCGCRPPEHNVRLCFGPIHYGVHQCHLHIHGHG